MFRSFWASVASPSRFPRVRGDVPAIADESKDIAEFSPRARGCSYRISWGAVARRRFPRVRGDVPLLFGRCNLYSAFSPRARGCSSAPVRPHSRTLVFPACAGMFLDLWFDKPQAGGFPRVRGDVPWGQNQHQRYNLFSPRARGCSGLTLSTIAQTAVFPACAGMFLIAGSLTLPHSGFPRVRGDVPHPGA